MDPKNIDQQHLTITGAHKKLQLDTDEEPHIEIKNDVLIIVTQAYGPTGESLMGMEDAKFDGYPAVSVGVRYEGVEGIVHLSPFHGDRRKKGLTDIPVGTKCELFCPVTKQTLDHIGKVGQNPEADYYALYLTPRLSEGALVAISDIWGDYHSRIVDDFELISTWATQEEALEEAAAAAL